MKLDRSGTHSTCNFLEALRLVQHGCQVRRAGWDPSLLYISHNRTLDRVELVCEEDDGNGRYWYATPWLGGAAIVGPPEEDLLAEDWTVVHEQRVPTSEGGKRAEAAALAAIAAMEKRGELCVPPDGRCKFGERPGAK